MKVALIGYGYWGQILAAGISRHDGFELSSICDRNIHKLNTNLIISNKIKTTGNYNDVLSDKEISVVFIATQTQYHYALAKEAIIAGKKVFLEKPATISETESLDLKKMVDSEESSVVVNHIYTNSPQYELIGEMIENEEVLKFDSKRFNVGNQTGEREIGVMENLMYHDLYMVDGLFNLDYATNIKLIINNIRDEEDDCVLNFSIGKTNVNLHASYVSSRKIRDIEIIGEQKIYWNDLEADSKKLKSISGEIIYPKEHMLKGDNLNKKLDYAYNVFTGKTIDHSLETSMKIIKFIKEAKRNA